MNSNQQSKVKEVELDLNQVGAWTHPRVTFDQNLKEYGELFAPLIEEYYETYDPIVFDRNKELILSEYNKQQTLYPNKQHSFFFNRLKKIIYLYRVWNKLKQWRDPLLVQQMGFYNGIPYYFAHPGRDRLIILKHFRIPSYKFVLVNHEDLTPDLLPELQPLWPASKLRFDKGQSWAVVIENNYTKYGSSLTRWLSDPAVHNTISTIANPDIVTPRMLALQRLTGK